MKSAPLPDDERARLKLLRETGILDTLEERAYDDLTNIAAQICGTPIALISLIDKDRQWFKSHHGLDARETPREYAFCAHAILQDDVFVVEDAGSDERFHDNPLYTGEPHVKFYAGAPLIMNNNLRLGTLCVIANESHHITDSQKESLQALSRQVVSLLELRLRLKELESLDQAKNEFLAIASHELRTPLTAICGSLELLICNKEAMSEESNQQLVSMAFRNSQRLLNIVNDVLDATKLMSGKLHISRQTAELHKLLSDAVEINTDFCNECGTKLRLITPDNNDTITIACDVQRIMQVMNNLISNAAKFTHTGDTIEVGFSTDATHAHITVSDHGPGIPADKLPLLYKKFQKFNFRDSDKHPGTGLGLNICKQIIELHNGELDVDSVANVKTTFHFTLPLI